MRTAELFAFMRERDAVRARKEHGYPKPWTTDQILQTYRFCNVRREDDAVTRWIADYWRKPYEDDPNVWFLMTVARLVNWPDTLGELRISVVNQRGSATWDSKRFVDVMNARKKVGKKVFSGAYIVSTNGLQMDKAEYLAERVLTPLWEARAAFAPAKATLYELFEELNKFRGLGSFMAAQVVADVKFTPPYRAVRDWWSFAQPGPGSRRGLNRVCERPVDAPWLGDAWRGKVATLCHELAPMVKAAKWTPLSAQDVQNCLCEWDKYERVRLGEGFPRAKYPGV